MKIDWIKFHGIYGDLEYIVGLNGVRELRIEMYSTEPFCGRSQLRIYCDGDVHRVRSLEGSNYDFKKSKEPTNTAEKE